MTTIIAELLGAALKPANKTKVMYNAALSFSQVNHYLTCTIECELLKEVEDNLRLKLYRTTEKGKRFLEVYERITHLLQQ